MTKQPQDGYEDYLAEFKRLLEKYCQVNANAQMLEEVAICYENGLTMDECLDYVDMQCGLSELFYYNLEDELEE